MESGGDREREMPKEKSVTVLVMVWFAHLRGGMIREISEKCLMTGSKLDDGISHYLSSGYVEPCMEMELNQDFFSRAIRISAD